MTSILLQVLLTQFLFMKVMSYLQPYSLKPYIVREQQVPQKAYITEHKAYHQSYPPNYAYPAYKLAEPVVIPAAPPKPIPLPETTTLKTPVPATEHLELPSKCPSNLDAHVLNNLAIALQLLIVNNIISNPPEPNHFVSPLAETVLELAFPANGKYSQETNFQMPNSKFLGSSNFGTDMIPKAMLGLGSVAASPRPGLALMSPYDAIASNLPLSDISSSYLSKRDFQSPYAAIIAADNNKELFSMADFF